MKTNETVFVDEDLVKLGAVIKNTKDQNTRKRLLQLQHSLQKKIQDRKEAADNRKRSFAVFSYMFIIPITIVFTLVGVYYFLQKEGKIEIN